MQSGCGFVFLLALASLSLSSAVHSAPCHMGDTSKFICGIYIGIPPLYACKIDGGIYA